MKAQTKALLILMLFALGVGAFWYVGNRVHDEVIEAASKNPLLQIEDYQKGLMNSSFKLTTYGGQLRLLGKVDHGPFILSAKKLALASVRLTVDPFQIVTSPWKSLIENLPLLKKSHIDLLINLNQTFIISGSVPEMEVSIPTEAGNFLLNFSGIKIEAPLKQESYAITASFRCAAISGPEQLEIVWGDVLFSAQGKEALRLIPTDWKSDFTLSKFSLAWVDKDSPQNITIDEVLTGSKGNCVKGIVNTGALYQVKGLMFNGQSFGNLDYSIGVEGLSEEGLVKMANWLSQVYAISGQGDETEKLFETLGPEFLPILHKVLGEDPELEVRVKTSLPSYGENEGIVQLRLTDEKHLPFVARVLGGVSLDFDPRAATQLARFGMLGTQDLRKLPVESQEVVASNFLRSLVADGWIETKGPRYSFNASYSGKEEMVRYGKSGAYPFKLHQFAELMGAFINQR